MASMTPRGGTGGGWLGSPIATTTPHASSAHPSTPACIASATDAIVSAMHADMALLRRHEARVSSSFAAWKAEYDAQQRSFFAMELTRLERSYEDLLRAREHEVAALRERLAASVGTMQVFEGWLGGMLDEVPEEEAEQQKHLFRALRPPPHLLEPLPPMQHLSLPAHVSAAATQAAFDQFRKTLGEPDLSLEPPVFSDCGSPNGPMFSGPVSPAPAAVASPTSSSSRHQQWPGGGDEQLVYTPPTLRQKTRTNPGGSGGGGGGLGGRSLEQTPSPGSAAWSASPQGQLSPSAANMMVLPPAALSSARNLFPSSGAGAGVNVSPMRPSSSSHVHPRGHVSMPGSGSGVIHGGGNRQQPHHHHHHSMMMMPPRAAVVAGTVRARMLTSSASAGASLHNSGSENEEEDEDGYGVDENHEQKHASLRGAATSRTTAAPLFHTQPGYTGSSSSHTRSQSIPVSGLHFGSGAAVAAAAAAAAGSVTPSRTPGAVSASASPCRTPTQNHAPHHAHSQAQRQPVRQSQPQPHQQPQHQRSATMTPSSTLPTGAAAATASSGTRFRMRNNPLWSGRKPGAAEAAARGLPLPMDSEEDVSPRTASARAELNHRLARRSQLGLDAEEEKEEEEEELEHRHHPHENDVVLSIHDRSSFFSDAADESHYNDAAHSSNNMLMAATHRHGHAAAAAPPATVDAFSRVMSYSSTVAAEPAGATSEHHPHIRATSLQLSANTAADSPPRGLTHSISMPVLDGATPVATGASANGFGFEQHQQQGGRALSQSALSQSTLASVPLQWPTSAAAAPAVPAVPNALSALGSVAAASSSILSSSSSSSSLRFTSSSSASSASSGHASYATTAAVSPTTAHADVHILMNESLSVAATTAASSSVASPNHFASSSAAHAAAEDDDADGEDFHFSTTQYSMPLVPAVPLQPQQALLVQSQPRPQQPPAVAEAPQLMKQPPLKLAAFKAVVNPASQAQQKMAPQPPQPPVPPPPRQRQPPRIHGSSLSVSIKPPSMGSSAVASASASPGAPGSAAAAGRLTPSSVGCSPGAPLPAAVVAPQPVGVAAVPVCAPGSAPAPGLAAPTRSLFASFQPVRLNAT